MEYKDYFGEDIEVGDIVVYPIYRRPISVTHGTVLELTTYNPKWGFDKNPRPAFWVDNPKNTKKALIKELGNVVIVGKSI